MLIIYIYSSAFYKKNFTEVTTPHKILSPNLKLKEMAMCFLAKLCAVKSNRSRA